ncbi:lipolytic protein [Actibacterium mucosum KCTC 23349]|uniref:Lipolytic protein n=1 Tax=Actibacterium mucosum KCTC 23349 TaxID=1454373 RepID=A0A037ZM26_9RHOB|nr:SGNH/GDSL hydrolase family protein [Actibacterium mucosum]KAJ57471.1 lipolytic protein [Actibacterium mucosum KCTC 23349]
MPTLLTFGDSNTHGSLPIAKRGERRRLGPRKRWPGVAARRLEWELIEAGLPGRTAQFPDPVMGAYMDGREGLNIALRSHGPIDVMTLMLGTNDQKTRFGADASMITAGIAALLDMALGDELQDRHEGFKVLLISPPAVREVGLLAGEFLGAAKKSAALPGLYAELADKRGAEFMDAGAVIETSDIDGIHFGAEAHAALGNAVAEKLGTMLT